MKIPYFWILFTFLKRVDPEWLRMIMKTKILLLFIHIVSKLQWNLKKKKWINYLYVIANQISRFSYRLF